MQFSRPIVFEPDFDRVAVDARRLAPWRWLAAIVVAPLIFAILGRGPTTAWAAALALAEGANWLTTGPFVRRKAPTDAHRTALLGSLLSGCLAWLLLSGFFWTAAGGQGPVFSLLVWSALLLNAISFAFRSRVILFLFSIPTAAAMLALPVIFPRFSGAAQLLAVSALLIVAAYAVISGYRNVVAARTLADVTAELARQKTAAEAANDAKSAFLAMMSHELRTPMNGVLGMAHALERTGLNTEQADYVATLIRSGDGLMAVLNDVLDLSKIEAGRFEIEASAFDLHRLLAAVRDLWADGAADKGLGFDLIISPEVPAWVLGDETRIRQILLNLVSNAVKFTSAGQIVLAADASPDGRVALCVQDSGPGIDPKVQTQLFNGFTQADASIARRFGGTGLGLAISRRLARMMGGDIRLQSRPGEGSAFTLALPLPPAERPAAAESGGEAAAPLPTGALTVLVVDDNPTNLKVAQALLGAVGCEVVTAQDGFAALDVVRTQALDLVLMDIQMPRMDGPETLRRLRQVEAGARLTVAALTANAMAGERERLIGLGFDDYISKPLDPQALIALIGRAAALDALRAAAA